MIKSVAKIVENVLRVSLVSDLPPETETISVTVGQVKVSDQIISRKFWYKKDGLFGCDVFFYNPSDTTGLTVQVGKTTVPIEVIKSTLAENTTGRPDINVKRPEQFSDDTSNPTQGFSKA